VARDVSEGSTGVGIDVGRMGLVTRHPPVRERLEVAPASGELLRQDAG
jgi:hypothetical protein